MLISISDPKMCSHQNIQHLFVTITVIIEIVYLYDLILYHNRVKTWCFNIKKKNSFIVIVIRIVYPIESNTDSVDICILLNYLHHLHCTRINREYFIPGLSPVLGLTELQLY